MAILSAEKLNTGYNGNVLLRDFDLRIEKPSFVVIAGHNGCGKSTLLKSLAGNLPFQGTVTLLGKNLKDYSARSLRKSMAFLSQQNALNFSMPVEELVVMGSFCHKSFFQNYDQQDYAHAEQILASIGIEHLKNKDFNALSGGEQQLVWIAQLLMQNTPVVMLDEPTQHLDVYYRKRILDILYAEVRQKRKTVLFSTHDLLSLRNYDGILLSLSNGRGVTEALCEEKLNEVVADLEQRRL
ncbi:ABC transporter ATP-binding protein [Cytophagaceae bacterium ABcell3]|nr:ABC transporter ATP-binding protein [Cytophagaceae bacterium ABcell3]